MKCKDIFRRCADECKRRFRTSDGTLTYRKVQTRTVISMTIRKEPPTLRAWRYCRASVIGCVTSSKKLGCRRPILQTVHA